MQPHALKGHFAFVTDCTICYVIFFRYGAIKGKLGNLKVGQVADCVQHRKGESLYVQAKLVIDTIGKYVSSADEEISIDHVPTHHMQEDGLIKPIEEHKRRVSKIYLLFAMLI